MSTFEVKVYRLEIMPHPNADAIELAKVGDYVSIVKKNDFKTGDLGVYIPEQAIVPEWILQEMGLVGKLSGADKNRVKAIKLRGVLSQGLIFPVSGGPYGELKEAPNHELFSSRAPYIWGPPQKEPQRVYLKVQEGSELSSFLGITKWEPIIPQHMRGKAAGVALNITVNYDVENIKKYNTLIREGEFVAITEKVHGTNVQFGYIPKECNQSSILHLGCYSVTSKGLGGKGILLDFGDKSNLYTRTVEDSSLGLGIKLPCIKGEYKELVGNNPIYIIGEIYGPGVQRGFGYGISGSNTGLRIFDIAFGERGNLKYFDYNLLNKIGKNYDLPLVPLLYVGPFTKSILETCTKGRERVSGKQLHMREGCVVRPLQERYDDRAGRVVLKSVSEEYLLRQGDVTEYA